MRALFTGGRPPGPLPANLHGHFDDFIEHLGILPHGVEPGVRRRPGGGRPWGLQELTKGLADDLGLRAEASGADLDSDDGLQVFGSMDFHAAEPPRPSIAFFGGDSLIPARKSVGGSSPTGLESRAGNPDRREDLFCPVNRSFPAYRVRPSHGKTDRVRPGNSGSPDLGSGSGRSKPKKATSRSNDSDEPVTRRNPDPIASRGSKGPSLRGARGPRTSTSSTGLSFSSRQIPA
jgi:hypothetical protein